MPGRSEPESVPHSDEVFESFIRKRDELNEKLDVSRRAIDEWLEQQPMPPPITALANLEVLLKTRRDLLAQFVVLDDEFMLHLIKMRDDSPSS